MKEPTIKFHYENDDGEEIEVNLPAVYEVCTKCCGTGSIVNPAIDGNGLTREDFDQDPGFEEDYFSGVYDIQCPECDGERLIAEVDENRCNIHDLNKYNEYLNEQDRFRREDSSERFMYE